jgi:nucleotide-binding universal stress UspA family protein
VGASAAGVPPPGDAEPAATPVVRAFAPPGPERHAVVAWARRQAGRTGSRLEILVDPPPPAAGSGAAGLGRLLDRALGALAGRSTLVDRLSRAAAGARMLVVPQRLAGVDELVDTAYEPVTVVPDEPSHDHGPVVLALAPRTSDEAVDAAFDAAEQRGAPLLAVRVRHPAPAPASRDGQAEAVDDERREWWERLAAWRITHPGVPVELHVAQGDPALALVDVSLRARLLVLGRSGRGRVLASVATSPVAPVTLRARCPVLVVPPPGPPRRPWWPRSG